LTEADTGVHIICIKRLLTYLLTYISAKQDTCMQHASYLLNTFKRKLSITSVAATDTIRCCFSFSLSVAIFSYLLFAYGIHPMEAPI